MPPFSISIVIFGKQPKSIINLARKKSRDFAPNLKNRKKIVFRKASDIDKTGKKTYNIDTKGTAISGYKPSKSIVKK